MVPKKLAIVILSLIAANLAFADKLLVETEFGKVRDKCIYVHTRTAIILSTYNAKYQVKGQQNEVNGVKINKFLGVPYAASPTGNLRWKPVRFINAIYFGK